MSYPGAIPSYAGFTPGDTLLADNHASQHNSEQADIIALATKLGTGSSTPTSGLVLRSSGAGTSTWGQVVLTSDVSGVLPVANGGTGQSSQTGTGLPVAQTSPTINTPILSTPVIANFSSATHDHSNSANGGSALNSPIITTPVINQVNSTDHIALNATTNKLVKTTVLRQDDTTNTYQAGNSVTLTGWGVITATAASAFSDTVNLGVTFLQRPIVSCTFGGDSLNPGSTSYGGGGPNRLNASAEAISITTSTFVARVFASSNWTAGDTIFYQWIAIGEI